MNDLKKKIKLVLYEFKNGELSIDEASDKIEDICREWEYGY